MGVVTPNDPGHVKPRLRPPAPAPKPTRRSRLLRRGLGLDTPGAKFAPKFPTPDTAKAAAPSFRARSTPPAETHGSSLPTSVKTPAEAVRYLHRGVIQEQAFLGPPKGFARLSQRFLKQLGTSAVEAVPGLIAAATPAAIDSAHAVGALADVAGGHPGAARRITFERSRRDYPKIARAFVHQVGQDVRHPGEYPGYLFLDALAGLSLGAGGAERLSAAGRAASAAGEGASTLSRAGAAGKALLEKPKPQTFTLTAPGGESVERLLSTNPLARSFQVLANKERQRRLNQPAREVGGGRLGQAVSNLLGPEATFGRELRAERRVERDVARAPVAELRHAAGGQLEAAPVLERLPKRLRRGISRGENMAITTLGIFGDEAVHNPAGTIATAVRHHAGLEQEARANIAELEARIVATQRAAQEAEHQGAWDEAAQLDAQLAADRHALRDAHQLAQAHALTQADFKLAQPALERIRDGKASERFMKSAGLTREISDLRTNLYKERGLVSPESAQFRQDAPAAVYHGQPLTEETHVVRTSAPRSGALDALQGQLAGLDKQLGQLERQHAATAKRLRPRTPHEAEQRLAQLEDELIPFREKIAERVYHPEYPAPEDMRREQLRRNTVNGLIDYYTRYRNLIDQGLSKREARIELGRRVDPKKLSGQRKIDYKKLVETHASERTILEFLGTRSMRGVGRALREGGKPTVKSELARIIDAELQDFAAHYPEGSVAQLLDEIDALKTGLRGVQEKGMSATEREIFVENPISHEQIGQLLGHVPVGADERLGAQISGFKDYREKLVRQLEGARAKLGVTDPEIQTIVDHIIERRAQLEPVPGAFRTPLGAKTGSGVGQPFAQPQPGRAGLAPTDPGRRDSTITHEFTAGEVRAGNVTANATGGTASDYLRATQTVSMLDLYGRLWRVATRTRENEHQIPIRNPKRIPPELKRLLEQSDQGLPISKEELDGLTASDIDALQRHLHPEELYGRGQEKTPITKRKINAPLGTDLSAQGVRWVDRRYIADLGDIHVPGKIVKAADLINNPVRTLAIYARGAYILNLPANAGAQVLTQGFMAGRNMRRALELEQHYGPRATHAIDSLTGESKARAYSVPTGAGAKMNEALASFWTSFIDRYSRRSAFVHWADRLGYDVFNKDSQVAEREMSRLLFDPASKKDLAQAARRSNKDLVEFNNLTPFERNTLRHLIFVYPWVSRSMVWAARMMVEHPGKTFTLAQLGRYAEKQQALEIGPLVSYLKNRGYYGFKVHGHTYLIGTAPVNNFQTAADNGRLLGSLVVNGLTQPREAASPALDLAIGALTGQNAQGREFKGGKLLGAIQDTITSLPQAQALKRSGLIPAGTPLIGSTLGARDTSRLPDVQKPVFPGSGIGESLGPIGLGSLYPRRADLAANAARVQKERLDALPPDKRALARVQLEATGWLTEARRIGLYGPREPFQPELTAAVRTWGRREQLYAQEAARLHLPANRLTQADRLAVDYNLLVELGYYTRADADAELAAYRQATRNEIKVQRRNLNHDYLGGDLIAEVRQQIRDAGGEPK